jgi:predicted acyl esterase
MSMRHALGCAVAGLLIAGLTTSSALAQSAPDRGRAFEPHVVSQPVYGIRPPQANRAEQTTYVSGAGGTPIYVEAWLPTASGTRTPPKRIPTVLVITPYTGLGAIEEPDLMNAVVPRGYAYAQMHVRGTGNSGGCQEQFSQNEVDDAANVIEWIAKKAPWSNGVIGGSGRLPAAAIPKK